jgi:hypothetical protein
MSYLMRSHLWRSIEFHWSSGFTRDGTSCILYVSYNLGVRGHPQMVTGMSPVKGDTWALSPFKPNGQKWRGNYASFYFCSFLIWAQVYFTPTSSQSPKFSFCKWREAREVACKEFLSSKNSSCDWSRNFQLKTFNFDQWRELVWSRVIILSNSVVLTHKSANSPRL